MGKIGRNEPCWCGSGEKYKRCHLDREKNSPVNPWQHEQKLKKSFSVKDCLAPANLKTDCNGKIVSAHTVPIGSSLNHIAEDGHVLGYKVNFKELNKSNGVIRPQKLGIRQASTFNGFCQFHDKSLFACIEDQEFSGSSEQCSTMAFRIAAKEYYAKRSAHNTSNILRETDQGRDISFQENLQNFVNLQSIGLDKGLDEIRDVYEQISKAIEDRKFEQVSSIIFYFDGIFPVMFSGGFTPTVDVNGNKIQDLSDLSIEVQHLFLSSICLDKGSAIVLSWLNRDNAICRTLAEQLETVEPEKLPSTLFQMVIQSLENCYFSPTWYQNLSKNVKEHITSLTMDGVNPLFKRGIVKFKFDLDFNLPAISDIKWA